MKMEHYELIKLQIELIETYPYDKGNSVEVMEVEDFNIENVMRNWECYLKEESLENLDFYKQQKWFIPWMQGQFTPEMEQYFGESLDFKNRVAANNILATANHQRFVKLYKQNAITLLEKIEERLVDK